MVVKGFIPTSKSSNLVLETVGAVGAQALI